MGRPRTIAAMPSHEFREIASLLGTMRELAPMLGRDNTTISSYATGRMAVPEEVAEKLKALARSKIARLESDTILEPGIAEARRIKRQEVADEWERLRQVAAEHGHRNRSYLANRRSRASPRQYPAYRMTYEKVLLLARALKRYLGFIRGERQTCMDAQRVQDLDMELTDISRLAKQAVEVAQSAPPFDYYITNLEWFVISRALRFLDTTDGVVQARSLYQHWRKYKGMHFKGHGRYSYRGATTAPMGAIQHDKPTHPPREGFSRGEALGQEGNSTGHRDGSVYQDAEGGAGWDHIVEPDTPAGHDAVDVGRTIITGAQDAQEGIKQQPGHSVRAGGSHVVHITARGNGSGQQCPACGAGVADPCRPGCVLADI